MLNGHSPITHGNILDVSENIQNGKIRLDNIAPQLTINFTARGSSDSMFYWEFLFTRDPGSNIANLQEMQEFGWLYYTGQRSSSDSQFGTVIGKNYNGFDVYKFTSKHDRIHYEDGVAFQLGFSSANANKVLNSCGGNRFYMRVSGVSDVAGNELYGGTFKGKIMNDAYLLVTMSDGSLVPSVIEPSPK